MLAKTFYGFEDILEKELVDLGAKNVINGTPNTSSLVDPRAKDKTIKKRSEETSGEKIV